MSEIGVSVWCFSGRDMSALTDDETGSPLPADLGPWILVKRITITGCDADEVTALELIRRHGFCCFDPTPPECDE